MSEIKLHLNSDLKIFQTQFGETLNYIKKVVKIMFLYF